VAAEVGRVLCDLLVREFEGWRILAMPGEDLEPDLQDFCAAEVLRTDVAQLTFGFQDIAQLQPASREWRCKLSGCGGTLSITSAGRLGFSGAVGNRHFMVGSRKPLPPEPGSNQKAAIGSDL